MRIGWVLLFFAVSVTAYSDGVRLISYDQMMLLPSNKRVQYLKDIRQLLVNMEKRDEQLGVAEDVLPVRGEYALLLELFQDAKADDIATPQGAPAPADDAVPASCSKPNFSCQNLSAAEANKEIKKFRQDRGNGSNVCISGGFFSSYRTNQKIRGQCAIVTKFPADSRKPIFQCKPGYALCNPAVFPAKNQDGTANFHCEAYGPRDGYNITERCDQWYDAQSTSGALTYDPNHQDAWKALNDSIQKNYQSRCENNGGFQALFCTECQAMAEQIYRANNAAVNLVCANDRKSEEPPVQKIAKPQPKPKATPAPKAIDEARKPSADESSCGLKKMVAAGKQTFQRLYSNHPYSSGGYCGTGVGNIISAAGFQFAQSGRNAINYMQLAPEYGFVKLDVRSEADAPPGAILVYSGPCTPGYPHPEGQIRCSSNGDRVGHVTVKGDDGHYYTDGRTTQPHIAHRYLVGVFIPGPKINASCGG